MINERTPLAMYQVEELIEKATESDKTKQIKTFIKTFSKISSDKAKKLQGALEGLEIIKLKTTDIYKIIDFMPENASELNKVVNEASLDADETSKILETIKNHK